MSTSETVRVRLRYTDLDTFVERFAPNVTRGGLFLASRSPRPVGEMFEFQVLLAAGQVALSGAGKVIWVKEYDPALPQKAHGMGVQFLRIDPDSRDVLNRMLKLKAGRPGSGGPRSPSQPVATLRGGGPTNGTSAPVPRVDTNVDLAAEYGIDEATLRRAAADFRWLAAGRDPDQELDELLKPDPPESPTLAQALIDLPRVLDPSVRRRTGAFRTLEVLGIGDRMAPSTVASTSSSAAPTHEAPAAATGTDGDSGNSGTGSQGSSG